MKNQILTINDVSTYIKKLPISNNKNLCITTLSEIIHSEIKEIIATLSKINIKTKLEEIKIKEKKGIKIKCLSTKIIHHKINKILQESFNIKNTNRRILCKQIFASLEDSSPYNILKIDIKDFFESINISELKNIINTNEKISPHIKYLIYYYLDFFESDLKLTGIPRGIQLSSTLCNLYLKNFDDSVKKINEVFYYCRYVDDIFIIYNPSEKPSEFQKKISSLLPKGCNFNSTKTKNLELKKGAPGKFETIDYLGYNFKIKNNIENKRFRNVEVSISENKINKIKKRICRSFIDFYKNNNMRLLIQRINYLSSNTKIFSTNQNKRVLIGIYYNYNLINTNLQLKELDRFTRILVLKPNIIMRSSILKPISSKHKKHLLSCSFEKCVLEKRFKYFNPQTLSLLKKCWEK